MSSLAWADVIAASNLIVATTAAIIALCSPMIAWRLTRRSQKDDQKRIVKLNIFGVLMENRPSSQTREVIRALNLIDVAFHDNTDIRRIWREYHGMITKSTFVHSEVGFELVKQKMEELQTAMAVDLGFGVDRFDVERVYQPNWLVDEDNLRISERQARLAALRSNIANGPPVVSTEIINDAIIQNTYLILYHGASKDSGYAFVSITNGLIVGSDIAGTRYNGTYEIENGRLIGKVTMSVPAGTTLVTGHVAERATDITIEIDLPQDFATGNSHNIIIQGREVFVSFRKISV